jgi:hypothetical protein
MLSCDIVCKIQHILSVSSLLILAYGHNLKSKLNSI